MSIDTVVNIVIAAVGSILVPCVIYLVQALSKLNETLTRLETRITSGVEPRLDKCEGSIGALYDKTNEHDKAIAALEAKA